jgi:hypothetical protein
MEVCVLIEQRNPDIIIPIQRGVSPYSVTPLIMNVGEYQIEGLTIELTARQGSTTGIGGLAISIEGTVRRILPGDAELSITADGGLADPPIGGPDDDITGVLELDGTATGISYTRLGGSLGYIVSGGGGYLEFKTLRINVEGMTYGAEDFFERDSTSNLDPGVVAVRNQTVFHINKVDKEITIPSIVGVGNYREDPNGNGECEFNPLWLLFILLLLILLFLWWYIRRKRKVKDEPDNQNEHEGDEETLNKK